MIKPITHDINFLKQKVVPATPNDVAIITDLKDTLIANRRYALGIAANMIKSNRQAIGIFLGNLPVIMINPQMIVFHHPYQTKEACLSLNGSRITKRYADITVTFKNKDFKPLKQSFSELIAEIIQHEIDHLNGILI